MHIFQVNPTQLVRYGVAWGTKIYTSRPQGHRTADSLAASTYLGDVEEAKVSDDHTATVNKDVFGAQVLVDNAASMQVAHALHTASAPLFSSSIQYMSVFKLTHKLHHQNTEKIQAHHCFLHSFHT